VIIFLGNPTKEDTGQSDRKRQLSDSLLILNGPSHGRCGSRPVQGWNGFRRCPQWRPDAGTMTVAELHGPSGLLPVIPTVVGDEGTIEWAYTIRTLMRT